MTAENTWKMAIDATGAAVSALDATFASCARLAGMLKKGGDQGRVGELKKLLDKAAPASEEDRRLALLLAYLVQFGRESLYRYLGAVRKNCLLLLLDGAAIEHALGVEGFLRVEMVPEGFRVTCIGDAASARSPAPKTGPYAPSRIRTEQKPGSAARATPALRAKSAEEARARRARTGQARREPRGRNSAGKPVMDMDQCEKLLADIAESPNGEAPPAANSYLGAALRGGATPKLAPAPAASVSNSSGSQGVVSADERRPASPAPVVADGRERPGEPAGERQLGVLDRQRGGVLGRPGRGQVNPEHKTVPKICREPTVSTVFTAPAVSTITRPRAR